SGQFAGFQRLMTMKLNLNCLIHDEDHYIFAELGLAGFYWSRKFMAWMLYQFHLPPETNKSLDYQFERKPYGFKAHEIRSVQAHIVREKIAAETPDE
ncbi:hypothetical protein DFH28DRAFT_882213, partial [Melampsora americana]